MLISIKAILFLIMYTNIQFNLIYIGGGGGTGKSGGGGGTPIIGAPGGGGKRMPGLSHIFGGGGIRITSILNAN